jgi:hypothetical protein
MKQRRGDRLGAQMLCNGMSALLQDLWIGYSVSEAVNTLCVCCRYAQ